jgi:hypothetical protein
MNWIKEIGIVLSYISMLVACYLFDWKPFGVFVSYLIETVVLLIVYSIIRSINEKKNSSAHKTAQPLANLLIGITPFLIFQFFMIGWMLSSIDPDHNFINENLLLTKEVFFASASMLLFYSIWAIQIPNHKKRLTIFQDNLIFKVIALSGTNILGFVLVLVIGVTSVLPVLVVMVVARILLEIYFGRKMKFV